MKTTILQSKLWIPVSRRNDHGTSTFPILQSKIGSETYTSRCSSSAAKSILPTHSQSLLDGSFTIDTYADCSAILLFHIHNDILLPRHFLLWSAHFTHHRSREGVVRRISDRGYDSYIRHIHTIRIYDSYTPYIYDSRDPLGFIWSTWLISFTFVSDLTHSIHISLDPHSDPF